MSRMLFFIRSPKVCYCADFNNARGSGAALTTINQEATIGPAGPRPRPRPSAGAAPAGGAGAGPRSGWNRYTLWLFGSTVIVFAPANVATVSTTVYLSAES